VKAKFSGVITPVKFDDLLLKKMLYYYPCMSKIAVLPNVTVETMICFLLRFSIYLKWKPLQY